MSAETRAFPIMRSGTFRDMLGRSITYSESHLADMAAAYSEGIRPAPLTLGHPVDDKPELGRVNGLVHSAGMLIALATVGATLIALARKGAYRFCSACFLQPDNPANPRPGTWYLKHVGMLGAVGPAVTGLGALNFTAPRDQFAAAGSVGSVMPCDFAASGDAAVSFSAPCGYTANPRQMRLLQATAELRAINPKLSLVEAFGMVETFIP